MAVLNLALLGGALGMLAAGPRTGGLITLISFALLSVWKILEGRRVAAAQTPPAPS